MVKVFIISTEADKYKDFFAGTEFTAVAFEEDDSAKLFAILKEEQPTVLLLDVGLVSLNWIKTLKYIKSLDIPCRSIILCAKKSIRLAVEAMHLGAFDLLEKPVEAGRLVNTVRAAAKQIRRTDKIKHSPNFEITSGFGGIIGSSQPMQNLYAQIDNVADSMAPVFIYGESGTGKELCAEAIHRRSSRAQEPFVVLNCGAIPKDLIESELFGHIKGAFTGASQSRDGAALSANNGTLFLDEVTELALPLQAKLLRFVQNQTFHPVGSDTQKQVNVRFVCTSNRNPWHEVEAGRLREDLYYRLFVFGIYVPPLRERGHDILQLASHFLAQFNKEEGKHFEKFSADAAELLLYSPWPGNVRQLQNVIRSVVISENTKTITAKLLHQFLKKPLFNTEKANKYPKKEWENKTLKQIEEEVIEQTLQRFNGNVLKAAAALDISPSTIYRKQNKTYFAETNKLPDRKE